MKIQDIIYRRIDEYVARKNLNEDEPLPCIIIWLHPRDVISARANNHPSKFTRDGKLCEAGLEWELFVDYDQKPQLTD